MTEPRFTYSEKLACIQREIKKRERVYPHQVLLGNMDQRDADREIALMRAVEADYQMAVVKKGERLL